MNDYEKFYQLHHQESPFILGNAWNVKSAQLLEKAGFEAIGTSSGAIASSLGYDDGEKIPFNELLYIVQRIKASVNIPLSVDLERGYTDDLNQLNKHIQQLADTGITGINIEDAQGETMYLKKLSSIKNYLVKTNQQLFINARTDVFLQKLPNPFETTINRAHMYKEAGADSLFVTGVSAENIIKEITSAVALPVNVVGTKNISSIKTLAACGVKRISMAAFLYRATYNQLEKICDDIKTKNDLISLF